jgi:glycosyltransferase involved in cell wall biosynthesis
MIRVAIVAPVRQRCSIADYVRLHVDRFPSDIQAEIIPMPKTAGKRDRWRAVATKANTADIVHVHFEYGLFDPVKPYHNRYTAFMRTLRPLRLVTLHDHFPDLQPRWRHVWPYRPSDWLRDIAYLPRFGSWRRGLYRQALHYVVHTLPLREEAIAFAGDENVTLLSMPIPKVRNRWRFETAASNQLVTPGFIKPHKGYDEMLDRMAEHESWHWTIGGCPQDEHDRLHLSMLEERIARNGLDERVRITGYLPREEMQRLMASSSLAVFPFRHSAGSSSVAWAIGAGMPVAAADLSAFRSMKNNGAGIELLRMEDDTSWPRQIEELMGNPVRLSTLGRANAAYAESNGFDLLADRTAAVYRKLATARVS